MSLVFIDLETTGLVPMKNEIITMGVVVCNEKLRIKSKRYFELKPECKATFEKEAQKVHGISWKESQKFPDALRTMYEFFGYLD